MPTQCHVDGHRRERSSTGCETPNASDTELCKDPPEIYKEDLSTLSRNDLGGANDDRYRRHIRLLHIAPWQPADPLEAAVVVEMRVFSLPECPPYIALSYSWGYGQGQASIGFTHTQRTLLVSEDVTKAIPAIGARRPDLWIWIDAICINQARASEKSDQVANMGHIYREAKEVGVWLGSDPPEGEYDTDMQVEPMPASEGDVRALFRGDSVEAMRVPVLFRNAGLGPGKIRHLLKSPQYAWWNRLWVVQESASASELSVFVGSHAPISWRDFVSGFQYLCGMNSDYLGRVPPGLYVAMGEARDQIVALDYLRKEFRDRSKGLELVDLLRVTSASEVSEVRDRIFALLPLATVQDRKGIPVRYDLNPEEVFESVTRSIIRRSNSLRILHHTWPRQNQIPSGAGKEAHFPSWVPDFSSRNNRYLPGTPRMREFREWKASGDRVLGWTSERHRKPPIVGEVMRVLESVDGLPRELHLQGVVFDTVASVMDFAQFKRAEEEAGEERGAVQEADADVESEGEEVPEHAVFSSLDFDRQCDFLDTSLHHLHWVLRSAVNQPLPNADPRHTISRSDIVREIIAFMAPRTGRDERFFASLMMMLTSKSTKTQHRPANLSSGCPGNQDDTLQFVTRGHNNEALRLLRHELDHTSQTYVLFITASGFVGVASKTIQEGDFVVVPLASDAPFLLRPQGLKKQYTLVDVCFVPGIMHGELIELAEAGTMELERLILV